MATIISNVLPSALIGTAAEVTAAISGGTGKYALIKWDSIKETGEADPDGFEDILKNMLRKASEYSLNNAKVAGDGRTYDAFLSGLGIDQGSFETGVTKSVTTVAINLYGPNTNPVWPTADNL